MENTNLMARVREVESKRTLVIWIPNDGSSFVEGHGYRVAMVEAGGSTYALTGDWPYHGNVGERMPWFWGGPVASPAALAQAQETAREMNARHGISPEVVDLVVARSIARGRRGGRFVWREGDVTFQKDEPEKN